MLLSAKNNELLDFGFFQNLISHLGLIYLNFLAHVCNLKNEKLIKS